MITELQAVSDSKEGWKDTKGSTIEDIKFLSLNNPIISRKHADPQPTSRGVTQLVSRDSHLLCSPFIPLPSNTPAPTRKSKKKSVRIRDDIVVSKVIVI